MEKTYTLPGFLSFTAGCVILMGIITAEAFYPEGYTTTNSEISDLGSTREGLIHQPSAAIFNVTMLISGALIFSSALLILFKQKKLLFTIPFILFGLAVIGVGLFPGNIKIYQGIFALLSFTCGAFSAITSFKLVARPLSWLGILIGITSLIFLFGANNFIPVIGDGGTERWVAYPIVLWLTGLGGYLMGKITVNNSQKLS
jgi:hypothetical membrane protein